MEILTILIIVVVVIVIFEFLKHHFVKSSGKILITLLIIGIAVAMFFYATGGIGADFGEVKTTGAAVWDDFKDGVDGVNLNNQLPVFNTRKAYISL